MLADHGRSYHIRFEIYDTTQVAEIKENDLVSILIY